MPSGAGGSEKRRSVCGYAGTGKRGYFVPGIIALLALLAIGGILNAAALSHSTPGRLDGRYVATQIADTYQTARQLESPPPVTCPDNEPVSPGHRFVCHVLSQSGSRVPIEVVETGGGRIQITDLLGVASPRAPASDRPASSGTG